MFSLFLFFVCFFFLKIISDFGGNQTTPPGSGTRIIMRRHRVPITISRQYSLRRNRRCSLRLGSFFGLEALFSLIFLPFLGEMLAVFLSPFSLPIGIEPERVVS